MALSISDPISAALERTKLILFKPFDIGKWFVLGFCAFLSQCGEGGGGNFNVPTGGGGRGGGAGGTGPTPQEIMNLIKANLGIIIAIAIIALVVVLAISALITWLKSRGKFMFLDGIARNRGAVVEPWNQFRELGNSLFMFSFAFGLIAMVAMMGVIALGVGLAWPDIKSQRFGESAIAGLVVGGGLLVALLILLTVITLLLEDFVVPAMYLRQQRVMQAWSTVRQELLSGHVGSIVLFYLMKIVLAIAVGVIGLVATCATCCVAALPYIGTVILLPLIVFMRCYTLCFIEQYGPDWRIFVYEQWSRRCARCGYDLRAATGSGVCPECGTPYELPPPPIFPAN
jgi:hypothetical protein